MVPWSIDAYVTWGFEFRTCRSSGSPTETIQFNANSPCDPRGCFSDVMETSERSLMYTVLKRLADRFRKGQTKSGLESPAVVDHHQTAGLFWGSGKNGKGGNSPRYAAWWSCDSLLSPTRIVMHFHSHAHPFQNLMYVWREQGVRTWTCWESKHWRRPWWLIPQ